jgi:hypothetical protein
MVETTADVRRDIELTRERMTSTLAQLEQKLNLTQIVRDNPWPALGIALGAGFLLSGSGADVKAAEATRSLASTTRDGTRSRIAPALDDALSRLMQGLAVAVNYQVDRIVEDVQRVIGVPPGRPNGSPRHLADAGNGAGAQVTQEMQTPGANPYAGGQGAWAPQSADAEREPGGGLGRAD